jgi:hypothetical protein
MSKKILLEKQMVLVSLLKLRTEKAGMHVALVKQTVIFEE